MKSSLFLGLAGQFYMKLEEKMHAKEAELDKVHARTQVL